MAQANEPMDAQILEIRLQRAMFIASPYFSGSSRVAS
jgi:hypothetical protein